MPTIRQWRTKAHKNFGIEVREPYPGEVEWFQQHPDVPGMAAEDNNVVLNPYNELPEEKMRAVVDNETMRAFMRKYGMRPKYSLTPEQAEAFKTYSPNPQDVRETVAGRIASGDSSAGEYTPEQKEFADSVWRQMTEGTLE